MEQGYEREFNVIAIQGTNDREAAQAVLDEKSSREPHPDHPKNVPFNHEIHPTLPKELWPQAENHTIVVLESDDPQERCELHISDWDLAATFKRGGKVKLTATVL